MNSNATVYESCRDSSHNFKIVAPSTSTKIKETFWFFLFANIFIGYKNKTNYIGKKLKSKNRKHKNSTNMKLPLQAAHMILEELSKEISFIFWPSDFLDQASIISTQIDNPEVKLVAREILKRVQSTNPNTNYNLFGHRQRKMWQKEFIQNNMDIILKEPQIRMNSTNARQYARSLYITTVQWRIHMVYRYFKETLKIFPCELSEAFIKLYVEMYSQNNLYCMEDWKHAIPSPAIIGNLLTTVKELGGIIKPEKEGKMCFEKFVLNKDNNGLETFKISRLEEDVKITYIKDKYLPRVLYDYLEASHANKTKINHLTKYKKQEVYDLCNFMVLQDECKASAKHLIEYLLFDEITKSSEIVNDIWKAHLDKTEFDSSLKELFQSSVEYRFHHALLVKCHLRDLVPIVNYDDDIEEYVLQDIDHMGTKMSEIPEEWWIDSRYDRPTWPNKIRDYMLDQYQNSLQRLAVLKEKNSLYNLHIPADSKSCKHYVWKSFEYEDDVDGVIETLFYYQKTKYSKYMKVAMHMEDDFELVEELCKLAALHTYFQDEKNIPSTLLGWNSEKAEAAYEFVKTKAIEYAESHITYEYDSDEIDTDTSEYEESDSDSE